MALHERVEHISDLVVLRAAAGLVGEVLHVVQLGQYAQLTEAHANLEARRAALWGRNGQTELGMRLGINQSTGIGSQARDETHQKQIGSLIVTRERNRLGHCAAGREFVHQEVRTRLHLHRALYQ